MDFDDIIEQNARRGSTTEEELLPILNGELLDPDEADPDSLFGVRRWWGPLVLDSAGDAGKDVFGVQELVGEAHLAADPTWRCALSVPGELVEAAQRSFRPGLRLPLYGYLVKPGSKFWGRNNDLQTLRVGRHPREDPFPAGYQYPVTEHLATTNE